MAPSLALRRRLQVSPRRPPTAPGKLLPGSPCCAGCCWCAGRRPPCQDEAANARNASSRTSSAARREVRMHPARWGGGLLVGGWAVHDGASSAMWRCSARCVSRQLHSPYIMMAVPGRLNSCQGAVIESVGEPPGGLGVQSAAGMTPAYVVDVRNAIRPLVARRRHGQNVVGDLAGCPAGPGVKRTKAPTQQSLAFTRPCGGGCGACRWCLCWCRSRPRDSLQRAPAKPPKPVLVWVVLPAAHGPWSVGAVLDWGDASLTCSRGGGAASRSLPSRSMACTPRAASFLRSSRSSPSSRYARLPLH